MQLTLQLQRMADALAAVSKRSLSRAHSFSRRPSNLRLDRKPSGEPHAALRASLSRGSMGLASAGSPELPPDSDAEEGGQPTRAPTGFGAGRLRRQSQDAATAAAPCGWPRVTSIHALHGLHASYKSWSGKSAGCNAFQMIILHKHATP